MSLFKQQRLEFLRGGASFESADLTETVPPESVITVQDVMAVKEEREQLAEATTCTDICEDNAHLAQAAAAVGIVAKAAEMAPAVSPISSDAFVELANESFRSSSKTLGETIPQLRVADNGKVSEESLEGLGEWFKTGAKAFMGATNRFFGRIKLNLSQLNTSAKGLTTRIARVTAKMNSRRGVGGKPLKVSNSVKFQLVKGNGYSGQLIADAQEFWAAMSPVIQVMTEYEQRLTEFTKKRVMESISSGSSMDFLSQLNTADLLKRLEALLASFPVVLGNRRLGADMEYGGSSLLNYDLLNAGPDAGVLAKHLDAPVSLSNDELVIVLQGLNDLVQNQLTSLERTIEQTERSYTSVEAVLSRLNDNYRQEDDGRWSYDDLGDGVNSAELLRLEYQLVGELGRCGERLHSYYSDVANQLDAILVLAEESIFQD